MEHRAPTWDDRLGCSVGMIGLDTWIGSAPSYRKHPHSLVSYNKFYPFRGDTKIYYSSSGHLKWILLSLKVGISGAKPLVLALGRASDESLPQARKLSARFYSAPLTVKLLRGWSQPQAQNLFKGHIFTL
jgi:hypothetical protein